VLYVNHYLNISTVLFELDVKVTNTILHIVMWNTSESTLFTLDTILHIVTWNISESTLFTMDTILTIVM